MLYAGERRGEGEEVRGGVCVATRVHGEERKRVSGVCKRVVGAPRRAWTCKSDDQRGEVIDYYLE